MLNPPPNRSRIQRLSRSTACVCVLAAACVVAFARVAKTQDAKSEAAAAVYVRTDSDKTTVVTPRLRAATNLGPETHAEVVYTVDVWTSASIDIRTSASKVVTEQRDEIDVNLGQDLGDLRLNAGYRYSTEPDYESNGGSLGVEQSFADKSATLGLDLSAGFDSVGRAGHPDFDRSVRNLTGRLVFTQAIDRITQIQGIYELGSANGYLSSPYRFVGIGSDDGSCVGAMTVCVAEAGPDERLRNVLAVRAQRALGEMFSAGIGYRFYTDDWSLTSHTMQAEVSLLPDVVSLITLRYRMYFQNAAEHYKARYLEPTATRFYTRDKELSPLTSHRIGLDFERAWKLDERDATLRTVLSVGPTFYSYSDFVPLTSVTALEVSFAMVLQP